MDAKALTSELAGKLGRDEGDINLLCGELASVIGDIVSSGDSVAIPSFGSFEPKKRNERIAMHPSTGKKILIPPKLSVIFRPSAMLKQKIRNK